MRYYEYDEFYEKEEEEENTTAPAQIGCKFCWDEKRKQEKQLMFFDQANNLRVCNYCPWCGRAYGG